MRLVPNQGRNATHAFRGTTQIPAEEPASADTFALTQPTSPLTLVQRHPSQVKFSLHMRKVALSQRQPFSLARLCANLLSEVSSRTCSLGFEWRTAPF
jgi:hypothetical protein